MVENRLKLMYKKCRNYTLRGSKFLHMWHYVKGIFCTQVALCIDIFRFPFTQRHLAAPEGGGPPWGVDLKKNRIFEKLLIFITKYELIFGLLLHVALTFFSKLARFSKRFLNFHNFQNVMPSFSNIVENFQKLFAAPQAPRNYQFLIIWRRKYVDL